MAGSLGDLVVALHADLAQFQSDMGRAARISQREWKKVSDHAVAAGKTVAFAGTIAGAAMLKMGSDALKVADDFFKMSQKVGVSVEGLSELAYAGKLADVSVEALGQGLKKLSVNMLDAQAGTGDARLAFQALGVNVEATRGVLKTSEQVFREVADKFASMEDGAGKTALAVKLFGRAGADMIPLLNAGSKGLNEMAEEARKFGVVISTDAGKRAEQFNDDITRLTERMRGFGISMTLEALPALQRFVEQMVEGTRIAGGFLNAIRLFGLSTITLDNAGQKIAAFRKEIEEFEQSKRTLQGLPGYEAQVSDIDAQIADLQKKIEFAKLLQRQSALAGAGGDTPGEAARMKGNIPAKTKAPGLPDLEAAKRAATELAKQRTFVANQWAEEMERQAQIMAEVAQLTDDYNRREREGDKEVHDARMKSWFEFIDAQREAEENAMRLAAGFDENGEKIKKSLTEMGEFAKEAARNIQDAFADGLFDIMQGKFDEMGANFKAMIDRMVANALAAQLLKKMFGDMDTTGNIGGWAGELIKMISGGFGGSGITSTASMASMSGVAEVVPLDLFGGFATGTDYVPETGPYLLHKGEAVLTAEENAGGGGRGVVVNFNVTTQDANSFRASRNQILSDMHMAASMAFARNG